MKQKTNTVRNYVLTLLVLLMTAAQASGMPLYVKTLDDRTITLEVEPGDPIDNVRLKILDKEGIATDRQRLIYGGTTLEDGHTLADYGIQKDAVVYLMIRQRTVTINAESGAVMLQNGDVLTGTGGVGTHVVIDAGATVTLSGVDIYTIVYVYEEQYPWPAIHCLGDAVIILDDGTNNRIKSNSPWYPGIYIPSGHTLTIRGKGSLEASNSGQAAGIGAGPYLDCGNIRIEDGNITATGTGKVMYDADFAVSWSNHAAAIGGCSEGDCGNITITGGSVDAYGALHAAAIGGGYHSECGTITIPSGVTYVRAKTFQPSTGEESPYSIGPGEGGTCSSVTIGGMTGYVTDNPYVYAPTDVPYTVTFSANDGTGTTTTQGFYSNTPQALVANTFTRTDYVFLGWNTKPDGSGKTYTDGEAINNLGNVTLYAQWHTLYNVISYDANGGTGTMADQTFVWDTPQALAANTFTRMDYVFMGWNTRPDGSGKTYTDGETVNNIDNVTLYAQWQAGYTVSFDANGGSGTMAGQAYLFDTLQALPANTFTRAGYDFTGWNTEADGSGTDYTDGQTFTNLGHRTLYAQWTLHYYSITYSLNGGTNASGNPATYTIESDDITLEEPTRFGFIFDGWTYDGQTVPTKDVTIAHGSYVDKTFTAHWTPGTVELTPDVGYYKLVNSHTLTGTGGSNTHITIADGATVTLSGVTITDITDDNVWAGISCEGNATIILADGTTNTVKGGYRSLPGVTVPKGKTLTIRGSGTLIAGSKGDGAGIGAGYWDCGNIIIEGGTIIATGGNNSAGIGGGIYVSCDNITITDGVTSVTATAGAGAPYSIGSGSNSTVGTVTIGGVVTGSIPQSPFTYTPSDTTPYTVTFDANGGEGSMDAQNFISNAPQVLTANSFTRTNYEFDGWNTAANGSGYAYRDGQTVVNLGNVTLYAQWKPILITNTINSSTGDIELVDDDVVTGTGGRDTHVTIADGATVTLYNVNITSITSDHEWAGITCLGDATIIVKGTSAVKGGHNSAGIFVPSGKTLTITGDGSLTATGKTRSAGIGGNTLTDCGNIVIDGGTITAVGSTAAAGIGGGYKGSCGDITITGGVTRVSATTTDMSDFTQAIIGNGHNGSVGTITIAPELIDVTSGSTRTLTAPATAPTITTQPSDLALTVGYDDGHELSIAATVANGHTIAYQWYTNTANTTENGTPIDGATDVVYFIPTGKAIGTTEYYYCVVTATRSSDGFTATATSDVATVKVYSLEWAGSGTGVAPYVINTAEQLDLLAERVNGGEGSYASAWYELGNDISFDHGTAFDEHNFDGIGLYDDAAEMYQPFNGHFDGKGYTVSGIRIYKGGEEEEDDEGNTIYVNSYKGLFAWIGSGAEVKNLALRDARITGHTTVGGIVGLNTGTVSHCYVGRDVVIHALAEDASEHGGIAGYNMGTVTQCVSAATVSIDDGSTFNYTSGPAGCQYYGGIVGYNDSYGTLSGNLALGATVSAAANDSYGAIAGHGSGTIGQNYYSGCTVGGVASSQGVDVGVYYNADNGTFAYISDIADNIGAVPALRDGAANSSAIGLMAAVPATLDLGWGAGKYPVQLSGRTLYKDGDWNTLCLPFSLYNFTGTPLEGATVMTLGNSPACNTGYDNATGTLYLDFVNAYAIEAGVPYIVKWDSPVVGGVIGGGNYGSVDNPYNTGSVSNGAGNSGSSSGDIVNPVFMGVTISNEAPADQTVVSEDRSVTFLGTYDGIHFDGEDRSILFLGAANTLYWPEAGATVGACRAYFQLSQPLSIRRFALNFGDGSEETGIVSVSMDNGKWIMDNDAGAWYTLDGRKLDGQPTAKGLYIHGGKKVVRR